MAEGATAHLHCSLSQTEANVVLYRGSLNQQPCPPPPPPPPPCPPCGHRSAALQLELACDTELKVSTPAHTNSKADILMWDPEGNKSPCSMFPSIR